VREAAGQQLQGYRLARQHAESDHRQLRATQVAQLRGAVATLRADLHDDLTLSASALRSSLHDGVAAIREDVLAMLRDLADARRTGGAARHEARVASVYRLRSEVAERLDTLQAERGSRSASTWSELHQGRKARAHAVATQLAALLHTRRPAAPAPAAPVPAAPAPAALAPAAPAPAAPAPAAPQAENEPQGDLMQRLGQVGLIAYAQMARVAILRTLETGTLGEANERQVVAHIEGLAGNVHPFLAELTRALGQLNAAERSQLGEIVDGVRRNVTALHDELDLAPWPTGPSERQAFRQLIDDLRRQLAPLRADLDTAAHALQGGQSPTNGAAQPQPEPEPPQSRSYRDNLTTIHGIGPALQQRLDRAGICTYIQLALSTPEELRKALGEAGRLANVEDWIVQARSLAGMPS
jgi:predicted flap endonuclease-1-like 5' DNA nuclease